MEKIIENGFDRLLYFDTDSVMYIKRPGDVDIPTGDFLGEMTDEITGGWGEGARGVRFCSAGPKNYAFEVMKPDGSTDVVMKTKGIANYAKTLSVLNIKKMMEMVEHFLENKHDILYKDQFLIRGNKYTHDVVSKTIGKAYKVVSEKRCIRGNYTVPYGYID